MSEAPQPGAGQIRALFNPRSIALVGATDKSGWSVSTLANLRSPSHGFPGEVYLVSPRAGTVHGHRAHRSLSDIGKPVDLAYVMVPTAAVLPVLREGAGLGIRCYVVLTAGFAETGPAGRRREEEIAQFARAHGLAVLGPNGNGYVNAAAGITPYGLPIPEPLLRGPVGVVLQSGALASSVLGFAHARNLGISLLTSMGNESMVSVTDVMGYLVDDPGTKVITLFLEGIRRPREFARVARRAMRAGKPVVALKIGRTEHASHAAAAHTGALVGDDAVVDAAFRSLGVIRVRCVEDLMITAGLLAAGPLPGPRLGVVTPSGGASGIIADRAKDEGLDLPAFAPATAQALNELLPEFATVRNPLDVTGYVVVDRTLLGRALEVVAADPGIDVVVLLSEPPRAAPPDPAPIRALYQASARRIAAAPRPVVVLSTALTDVSVFVRELQTATGYPHVLGGIEHGMHAIGAAVRWSRAHRDAAQQAAAHRDAARRDPGHGEAARRGRAGGALQPEGATGVWAEDRAAAFLAEHGVPVVPSLTAPDEPSAVAAAESLGYPVVLKAATTAIAHKSEIGAVRLGLGDAVAVRRAYREVRAAASAATTAGTAAAAGTADAGSGVCIMVQPQRSGGVELLAGIVRDPAWGLVLAVGLGGIWVEVLGDTALRLLPAGPDEIRRALGELRGAPLLRGARGTEPADLGRVADVIADIAALATRLGDHLDALEVNPLYVRGARVEALDALITWR